MRKAGWTRATWSAAVALAAMLFAPQRLRAQEGVVAGTAVAAGSQRGLPGVQITVSGQAGRGAVSDASGRFRISGVTGSQVVLQARMLGYRPDSQVVRVGAADIRFVMTERALELNEIVVTGTAGGEQKRALGTSVSSVDVADVTAKTAVPSVDALLNGRTPGVVVLPGTGQIGAGAQIRIRGISTFSLSSNPLVYVDGVRVDNQTGTGITVQAFSSGVISRLNDFSPEEIESIEVLKGPAAATLYGTEAARGVINILTKKGAAGSTKYSFSVKQGSNWFQDAAGRISTNYCNSFTDSDCSLSPGDTSLYSINVYQTEKARGTPLFRTGNLDTYSANVSGGSPLFRFFASGEWSGNQGVDYANDRIQQSARTNLSVTPSTKFEMETSVGYIKSKTNLSCEAGCGGTLWGALYSNPVNSSKFCVGSSDPQCGWGRGFNSSPPESDRAEQFWQNLNRFTGSVTLRFNPTSWFNNRLAIGTDYTLEDDVDFLPYITNDTIAYFWGSNYDGFRYQNHHQAFYNTYDYTASANFNVRPTLTSKTAGGIQYYTNHNTYFSAEGDHFPAPGLETITAAGTKIPASSNDTKNNTLGFYLQEEIGWRDQLFVTGAARVDNNSAFGSDIKWVTYPKASLSWVASENQTVRRHLPSFIDNLRLRGAYGGSGQQPAYNTALRTLRPVAGPNSQSTLTPSTFGNPNLRPERVLGTELGFEAGTFGDRLGFDFTYYRDVSKDAILSRGVAPGTGFGSSTQYFNAGEIQKSGIELAIKAQVVQRRTYGWESAFNVSTNNGKIIRLNGTDTTIDNGSYSHRVGYAPYSWFSYRVLSATYDPATRKAINPICADGKGGSMPCYLNGKIQAPKVYLGRGIPPVEGSWTNTVRFLSNLRLYVMTDFATDYARLDNNLRIRCQIFYTCLEYVQPAKTDPRLLAQMSSNGTLRDFVINDASYLKLREVSLSYDVPERFSSKLNAHGVVITASGRNLRTWSPYTGMDPEMMFVSGNFGVDQAEYPPLTSLVFTIRANY